MSYVLEVLPALLNGAVVTLQVFFIVIVPVDSIRDCTCFLNAD